MVVLTASEDRVLLASCVEAGAYDLANKSEPFSAVLAKVDGAFRGAGGLPARERGALLAELRAARLADAERLAPFEQLSPRERQVLSALIAGQSAQQIAAEAPVALATVRTQIRGILTKLNTKTQLGAVALARRAGWSEEDAEQDHQI